MLLRILPLAMLMTLTGQNALAWVGGLNKELKLVCTNEDVLYDDGLTIQMIDDLLVTVRYRDSDGAATIEVNEDIESSFFGEINDIKITGFSFFNSIEDLKNIDKELKMNSISINRRTGNFIMKVFTETTWVEFHGKCSLASDKKF